MLPIPPWLDFAENQKGVTEIAGPKHNPKIIAWLEDLNTDWRNDEVPWCGIFIAKCLQATGYSYPKHYASALAYATFGVRLDRPAVGCIAVKKRRKPDGSTGGHVTFIVGRNKKGDLVGLGGNQSDRVCYKNFKEDNFIAFVWPSVYPKDERFNLPIIEIKDSILKED
ncbi:NlpC/P60 family protein [Acinetobacter variabilis]|uniref:NlpC/P60 family protein n=1 Tax=Acinetobacter variabilis TaxID=70346 RepID=UPI0028979FFA|nr:TIGR02594 family protein [Acinetobacter variabilis]